MRPLHQNRERVIAGVFPLRTGQIFTPGKNLRGIKRIGIRADLYDNRIEAGLLHAGKHLIDFLRKQRLIAALLRLHGNFIISDPNRAHFLLRPGGLPGNRLP